MLLHPHDSNMSAPVTAAHLLSSAGAAMMELDPSGRTFAELWRLWSEFPWSEPFPGAEEYMSVLAYMAEDPSDEFVPRVDTLSDAADFLEHVMNKELLVLETP